MDADRARTCIDTLRKWGYEVRIGKTLGHSFHYFSGTDRERLDDLQVMLDDPDVHAILCARGGYGTSRIIDQLDFSGFARSPKWIIGFSDITVLHAHLFSRLDTASLHAPMASAFNDGGAEGPFVGSLRAALTGEKSRYTAAPHPYNRPGMTAGVLVGGNLSLLAHLVGTPTEVDTEGCILFLEDIGEYLYHIDRMLIQLSRAGKLSGLAGLIVGGFTDMKDTAIPFGQTVEELILDKVRSFGYPVSFGFPVSHGPENYALKVGVRYSLDVNPGGVRLED